MSDVSQKFTSFENKRTILIVVELSFDIEYVKLDNNNSFTTESFSVADNERNYLVFYEGNGSRLLCKSDCIELFTSYTTLVFSANDFPLHCIVGSSKSLRGGSKYIDLLKEEKYFPRQRYPIKIICYLEFKNPARPDCSISSIGDNFQLAELQKLSNDFLKILEQTIASDVTLHVDGVNIESHRNVLQARSPVFDKMFKYDTMESAKNVIDIKDIRVEIIKYFLVYLYSGVVKNLDFDDACDLYYAADKYEVLSLREACKRDLLSHLSVDNACQMLSLANRHGDKSFKEDVLKYVKQNFKVIVKMESFEELSINEPKLALSVTRSYMDRLQNRVSFETPVDF